jgi:hypothetical protein
MENAVPLATVFVSIPGVTPTTVEGVAMSAGQIKLVSTGSACVDVRLVKPVVTMPA